MSRIKFHAVLVYGNVLGVVPGSDSNCQDNGNDTKSMSSNVTTVMDTLKTVHLYQNESGKILPI